MRHEAIGPLLARLDAVLDAHGLATRGAVAEGRRTIVPVGHAGSSIWPHFRRWRANDPQGGGSDPLDGWSRAVLVPVAEAFGAEAVFPSDRPYRPFQRWAMAAEGLRPSPLGLLIHPDYGLWHAYRGALAFDGVYDIPAPGARAHPCASCAAKPCLSACPVSAFDGHDFHAGTCRGYLASSSGSGCLGQGCAARLACPVGREFAYVEEQQRFHMAAFASD